MAVSFVYGRLEIVDKPDAGLEKEMREFIVEKFDKYRSTERDCDFNE